MTNNLSRRVREHKRKEGDSFTARYNVTRLVWYCAFSRPQDAIALEKKLKGGPGPTRKHSLRRRIRSGRIWARV